jgi:hypothetical protein
MRTMPSTWDVYVITRSDLKGPKLEPRRVTLEEVYTPLEKNAPRVGRSKSPTMAVMTGGAYLVTYHRTTFETRDHYANCIT